MSWEWNENIYGSWKDAITLLVRREDRKTTGVFILTIYNDPKKPTEEEIRNILNSFPPIFETIKKDLGITGRPKMYLKEP